MGSMHLSDLDPAVGVAASSIHRLLITDDGMIWAWSLRPFAPEEDGSTAELGRPVPVGKVDPANQDYWQIGPLAIESERLIYFGSHSVGQRGRVHWLRLTNMGVEPLVISGVTLTGEAASDFGIAAESFSGVWIYPGSFCEIYLRFTPGDEGHRTATLNVLSNASNSHLKIPLLGYGASGRVTCQGDGAMSLLHRSEVAVPVAISAHADHLRAVVRPGRHRVEESGPDCGHLLLIQEFELLVPIRVIIIGESECGRQVSEVKLMASETVRVALPVSPQVDVDSDEEEVAGAVRTMQAGECSFTVLQHLQVEFPLAIGALVHSDLEVIACPPGTSGASSCPGSE